MAGASFTSRSQLLAPGQLLRSSFRSLRASLPLARRLFVRDLRARYRMSALGFLWIVLPPAAQAAVLLYLNASDIVNSGDTGIPLTVFVVVGAVLWQSFVESLLAPGAQLAAASQMLARMSFPPESVLLAGLTDVVVNAAVRLVVVVPVMVAYGVAPGIGVLLVPFGLVVLVGLGFGIGLLLAPFGALYQDVGRVLSLVTAFWLLVTPVGYLIPERGPARVIARFNPVSPVLSATRDWLTGGPTWPGAGFVGVACGVAVVVLVGWFVLRLALPHLVDRFGT